MSRWTIARAAPVERRSSSTSWSSSPTATASSSDATWTAGAAAGGRVEQPERHDARDEHQQPHGGEAEAQVGSHGGESTVARLLVAAMWTSLGSTGPRTGDVLPATRGRRWVQALMAPRDVFISHSSGDAEIARELRVVLEEAGYSCWMAPDDIVGTETWTEQILAAIADSKVMLVLVSAAANASPHVSREVNLALGRKRAVLPIRIEPVAPEGPLEYLLSLVQRLDAFPPPMANHGPRILRRLESIVQRPQTTPLPVPDAANRATGDTEGPDTGPMETTPKE